MMDTVPLSDALNDRLTPRSAAQTLVGYQESHQIEHFMQEMLSTVFSVLPEDPFEYMTAHIAAHRPAPPPEESNLCGTAALWTLSAGGDPLAADHWRLRRCWLKKDGTFCVNSASPRLTHSEDGLLITTAQADKAVQVQVQPGTLFELLKEEDAVRPFAFRITPSPNATQVPGYSAASTGLVLAAGSQEQRDEWLALLQHFANAANATQQPPRTQQMPMKQAKVVLQGPLRVTKPSPLAPPLQPRRPMLLAKASEEQIAGQPPPRKPAFTAIAVPMEEGVTDDRGTLLKPILKRTQDPNARVPVISLPRNSDEEPMEALRSSGRQPSLRFSDKVERREFEIFGKARPTAEALQAERGKRRTSIPKAKPGPTQGMTAPPPAAAAVPGTQPVTPMQPAAAKASPATQQPAPATQQQPQQPPGAQVEPGPARAGSIAGLEPPPGAQQGQKGVPRLDFSPTQRSPRTEAARGGTATADAITPTAISRDLPVQQQNLAAAQRPVDATSEPASELAPLQPRRKSLDAPLSQRSMASMASSRGSAAYSMVASEQHEEAAIDIVTGIVGNLMQPSEAASDVVGPGVDKQSSAPTIIPPPSVEASLPGRPASQAASQPRPGTGPGSAAASLLPPADSRQASMEPSLSARSMTSSRSGAYSVVASEQADDTAADVVSGMIGSLTVQPMQTVREDEPISPGIALVADRQSSATAVTTSSQPQGTAIADAIPAEQAASAASKPATDSGAQGELMEKLLGEMLESEVKRRTSLELPQAEEMPGSLEPSEAGFASARSISQAASDKESAEAQQRAVEGTLTGILNNLYEQEVKAAREEAARAEAARAEAVAAQGRRTSRASTHSIGEASVTSSEANVAVAKFMKDAGLIPLQRPESSEAPVRPISQESGISGIGAANGLMQQALVALVESESRPEEQRLREGDADAVLSVMSALSEGTEQSAAVQALLSNLGIAKGQSSDGQEGSGGADLLSASESTERSAALNAILDSLSRPADPVEAPTPKAASEAASSFAEASAAQTLVDSVFQAVAPPKPPSEAMSSVVEASATAAQDLVDGVLKDLQSTAITPPPTAPRQETASEANRRIARDLMGHVARGVTPDDGRSVARGSDAGGFNDSALLTQAGRSMPQQLLRHVVAGFTPDEGRSVAGSELSQITPQGLSVSAVGSLKEPSFLEEPSQQIGSEGSLREPTWLAQEESSAEVIEGELLEPSWLEDVDRQSESDGQLSVRAPSHVSFSSSAVESDLAEVMSYQLAAELGVMPEVHSLLPHPMATRSASPASFVQPIPAVAPQREQPSEAAASVSSRDLPPPAAPPAVAERDLPSAATAEQVPDVPVQQPSETTTKELPPAPSAAAGLPAPQAPGPEKPEGQISPAPVQPADVVTRDMSPPEPTSAVARDLPPLPPAAAHERDLPPLAPAPAPERVAPGSRLDSRASERSRDIRTPLSVSAPSSVQPTAADLTGELLTQAMASHADLTPAPASPAGSGAASSRGEVISDCASMADREIFAGTAAGVMDSVVVNALEQRAAAEIEEAGRTAIQNEAARLRGILEAQVRQMAVEEVSRQIAQEQARWQAELAEVEAQAAALAAQAAASPGASSRPESIGMGSEDAMIGGLADNVVANLVDAVPESSEGRRDGSAPHPTDRGVPPSTAPSAVARSIGAATSDAGGIAEDLVYGLTKGAPSSIGSDGGPESTVAAVAEAQANEAYLATMAIARDLTDATGVSKAASVVSAAQDSVVAEVLPGVKLPEEISKEVASSVGEVAATSEANEVARDLVEGVEFVPKSSPEATLASSPADDTADGRAKSMAEEAAQEAMALPPQPRTPSEPASIAASSAMHEEAVAMSVVGHILSESEQRAASGIQSDGSVVDTEALKGAMDELVAGLEAPRSRGSSRSEVSSAGSWGMAQEVLHRALRDQVQFVGGPAQDAISSELALSHRSQPASLVEDDAVDRVATETLLRSVEEAAQKAAEEEAKVQALELEAKLRAAAEAEERRRAEDEIRRLKAIAEEEERRLAAEEAERQRLVAEEEAKRAAAEEEERQARLREAEEAMQRAIQEEAARRAAEEEAKQKAFEEEEVRRRIIEEEERRMAAEEAAAAAQEATAPEEVAASEAAAASEATAAEQSEVAEPVKALPPQKEEEVKSEAPETAAAAEAPAEAAKSDAPESQQEEKEPSEAKSEAPAAADEAKAAAQDASLIPKESARKTQPTTPRAEVEEDNRKALEEKEAALKKQQEEERKQREEEELARRKAAEEEEARRQAELEAAKAKALADAEAALKAQAEEEARLRAAEEEARRAAAALESARRREAAAAEAQRLEENEKRRQKAMQEIEARRQAEEAEARQRAEEAKAEKEKAMETARSASSGSSSRSQGEAVGRLLKTFIATAAGTLRLIGEHGPMIHPASDVQSEQSQAGPSPKAEASPSSSPPHAVPRLWPPHARHSEGPPASEHSQQESEVQEAAAEDARREAAEARAREQAKAEARRLADEAEAKQRAQQAKAAREKADREAEAEAQRQKEQAAKTQARREAEEAEARQREQAKAAKEKARREAEEAEARQRAERQKRAEPQAKQRSEQPRAPKAQETARSASSGGSAQSQGDAIGRLLQSFMTAAAGTLRELGEHHAQMDSAPQSERRPRSFRPFPQDASPMQSPPVVPPLWQPHARQRDAEDDMPRPRSGAGAAPAEPAPPSWRSEGAAEKTPVGRWQFPSQRSYEETRAPIRPPIPAPSSAWMGSEGYSSYAGPMSPPDEPSFAGFLPGPPAKRAPELSEASSAWSGSLASPDSNSRGQLADRRGEFGIPSLPLAQLSGTSLPRPPPVHQGASSGSGDKEAEAFTAALGTFTDALFRHVDAWNTPPSSRGPFSGNGPARP